MELLTLLREADEKDASDLYLIAGAVPAMSLYGRFMAPDGCAGERLSPSRAIEFARQVMTPEQWEALLEKREANLAYMTPWRSRFRVNVLWQRGHVGMVLRRVVENIPTLRMLGLPPVLRNIALAERGIVLITGATGSGKSTTMASMIDYRNHLLTGHVVTIEDPIEFLYRHRRSIVTQREVGIDTHSFGEALRNSLRQAPNVISIGEMRDEDSVKFSMHAAETGHLVFATLHSTNAVSAVKRLLNFFPSEMHERLLIGLSTNLTAVISQRLVRGKHGGRSCATEVMTNSPRARDLISRGETDKLREHINSEHHDGTQSMDLALYRLVRRGQISDEDALQNANSENDLRLRLGGVGISPGSSWEDLQDPWVSIPEDYIFPEDFNPPAEQAFAPDSYNNEGAANFDTGTASGISPARPDLAVKKHPEKTEKKTERRHEPPEEHADGDPESRESVVARYKDVIQQATSKAVAPPPAAPPAASAPPRQPKPQDPPPPPQEQAPPAGKPVAPATPPPIMPMPQRTPLPVRDDPGMPPKGPLPFRPSTEDIPIPMPGDEHDEDLDLD
ncbi:MAG: twitching motility protein PilU [Candidatus Sumerlaeota bacterium]|nr:twitching motility protein PilU [Candidatus Sumerlaeota bacterium]